MKRVMMEIGLLFVGLSLAGLHTLVCYKLLGLVATLVIVGVQVVIALGMVWIKSVRPIRMGVSASGSHLTGYSGQMVLVKSNYKQNDKM